MRVSKKKIPDDPATIVFRLCSILNMWALLQKNQDQRKLEDGVESLKVVIREALARKHGWAPTTARITNG